MSQNHILTRKLYKPLVQVYVSLRFRCSLGGPELDLGLGEGSLGGLERFKGVTELVELPGLLRSPGNWATRVIWRFILPV